MATTKKVASKTTSQLTTKAKAKEAEVRIVTEDTDEDKSMVLKGVEFFWAKLGKPVAPFGTLRWELQIRFDDEMKEALAAEGIKNVKTTDVDGVYSINLARKAEKADGSANTPVKVVDGKLEEVDGTILGNGSTGNVKVWKRNYEVKDSKGRVTKRGISLTLMAVQVTSLIVYEPSTGADFDSEEVGEETPAPKKGKKISEEPLF
jgi:hypothetical protein